MLNSTKSDSSTSIPSEPFYKELHSPLQNPKQESTSCGCNCHELHKNSCSVSNKDEPMPKQHETPCQKYLGQLPPKPQSSQSCSKRGKTDSKLKSLPTKRESIRMLYENKAVTENPLKSTLEHHFYNINTAKRVHHNHFNQQ